MKPTKTATTNTRLILPGGTDANDLPAEKIQVRDPNTHKVTDAFDTLWLLELEEVADLINGAAVLLRVWGKAHPPVAMHVTNLPDVNPRAVLDSVHTARALELLFRRFADGDEDNPRLAIRAGERTRSITLPGFLSAWTEAVRDTANLKPDPEHQAPDNTPIAAGPDREPDDTPTRREHTTGDRPPQTAECFTHGPFDGRTCPGCEAIRKEHDRAERDARVDGDA